ncbi:peptidase inhibitor family I36 protein [Amycolatopsis sp. NPDC051045]|uniref:peptidase inhibitor family I36 protein n=1 Tax=Amycolatopsis sp. NPDC051045 TaxID=3156922 RepID=UPI003436F11F
MGSRGRRIVRATMAAAAAGTMLMSLASTAHAAARDGHCDNNEFCLYWGINRSESLSDFATSIPDYGATQPTCYEFKGAGRGRLTCVKNNAVSAWNRTGGTVRLYAATSCTGDRRWVIQPGQIINDLSPLANQNQSHSLVSSGAC